MAQAGEIDPTVLDLVTDFFNAQFRLKPTGPVLDSNNVINEQRLRIGAVLRDLGEAYLNDYQESFDRIIDDLRLQDDNIRDTFFLLGNQLFVEGIQWKHIVTFFVFGAEFAYNVNLRGIVSAREVAVWLTQYISRELMPWIIENGGWEGVVNFAQELRRNQLDAAAAGSGRKWPFTLLGGAAGALGVISLGLFLRQ